MNSPCINVNDSSMTNEQRLLFEDRPKTSLSKAKADEEPKLLPFTKNDRNLFVYITAMLSFQACLNSISSIVMMIDEVCSYSIENYQIIIVIGALYFIIFLLVIGPIRIFRKSTYAILSLIAFCLGEAYLLGIIACTFQSLYTRFVNIFLFFDFLGISIYFLLGIKDRISLIKAIPFILIFNVIGFLLALFSVGCNLYEAVGTLLAGINLCFFHVWLLKMIHQKKIHGNLSLFKLKFIAPALIQIDLFFLMFFSIFFVGV